MMLHYYSYDYAMAEWPNDGEDPLHEYKDREEFLEWLLNNRKWAKDGGDKVPSEKAVLEAFYGDADTDICLNGFYFLQSRLAKEEARREYFE